MKPAELNRGPASDLGALAHDYLAVRDTSLALAEPLAPEDCVVQTIPEVSPTKWHLAHVTWFFETFCLLEHLPGYRVHDDAYQYLFNSYYYSAGQMHPRGQRGLLSRPLLSEVLEYRRRVDAAMLELMSAPHGDERLAFKIRLGLHHEQQHQELMLTDIKHVLFCNPLGPRYAAAGRVDSSGSLPLRFVERPGGRHLVGADPAAGFCFDNETPAHDVLLIEHALGNRLVTNGEFRSFIEDGGYADPRLWLADGWARVLSGELARPLYWSETLDAEFTLGGWQRLDADAPVCHVSYYEADAYARWAQGRLPLEAEWELAAKGRAVRGNFLDGGALRPLPARGPAEDGGDALRQLWGDVWEWTSSPYVAYPGFKPLAGTLGEYNGKFMANQMVVRGGSCASSASHLRASYRSFFYPHDRWQFLGFRLARDS